ncbi:hypothetical protein KAFR_0C02650 [Kazachstania africana CBS 2517]|uniref:RecA family profile 1 domain-containing protein n=1 Tax=Kazachstania africana (strain ATCC 22294 / BCRC 22015 / CBS 2517 / CECT 1963 / NBRC 1671 / NRRL Y-8276) TaxID=1071382 RepID=H2ASA8_KAZAF|nr:hypothetical protein KAFR_0C02650 [Kazachstania africana CBS 2517]CCF57258.1 hypothetical protein KAFR_0C02650 [Kazachstania africana CBS 2517]
MSLGISLSQLITDNPQPLSSGVSALDDALNKGFHSRSIYEIYGPPGVGKTKMGIQLVQNATTGNSERKVLWIETHVSAPLNLMDFDKGNIFTVTTNKFTQLLIFFKKLLEKDEKYDLILISGFSQLVTDHIEILLNRGYNFKNIHELKCKHLALILTEMTKYTHSKNASIVLLNDCMNTSFQKDIGNVEDNLEVVDDGSNFLVSSSFNSHRRKNTQVLRSSLVANSAMGNKDNIWEAFIRCSIGIFWNWKHKDIGNNRKRNFEKCRIAVVSDLNGKEMQNKKRATYKNEVDCSIVRFDIDESSGSFKDIKADLNNINFDDRIMPPQKKNKSGSSVSISPSLTDSSRQVSPEELLLDTSLVGSAIDAYNKTVYEKEPELEAIIYDSEG